MEEIEVIGSGYNGSRNFSIFENRQKVITNKPLHIIAEEMLRRYPKTVEEIKSAFEIFGVESMKDFNIKKLQPQEKYNLPLYITNPSELKKAKIEFELKQKRESKELKNN